ncbi:MAG TPA: carboxypeptidase-like regulatory domain-containing protein, partial [Pyrinomonadaceae bacterium]
LPAGATLLSAEVEGERVKPVLGADGSRVPLLRAGFNPSGAYTVSFVYLSSGAPFSKAGAYQMGLPKLDIPVNVLTWEVSLPDRVEVRQFGGNALAAELFPAAAQSFLATNTDDVMDQESGMWNQTGVDIGSLGAGQVGGIVADPTGAVLPNALITVTNKQTNFALTTRSDGDGKWVISGVQPGPVSVSIDASGFKSVRHELEVAASRPAILGTTVEPGSVSEVVTVTGDRAVNNNFVLDGLSSNGRAEARKVQSLPTNAPSQNVFNLQRRVAGILPVRVEVPKSGKSYRFVRPLVMDEETTISFNYKSR